MAKFESPRYKELGFYVNGEYRQFNGGSYITEVPAEIAVLESITDAVRVDIPEVIADKPKLPKGAASAK